MSKPTKAPEADEQATSPSPATGRTQVETNTVVTDNTEAPVADPYARTAEVTKTPVGDGNTILESYS